VNEGEAMTVLRPGRRGLRPWKVHEELRPAEYHQCRHGAGRYLTQVGALFPQAQRNPPANATPTPGDNGGFAL
jgi:hypothetical protein